LFVFGGKFKKIKNIFIFVVAVIIIFLHLWKNLTHEKVRYIHVISCRDIFIIMLLIEDVVYRGTPV